MTIYSSMTSQKGHRLGLGGRPTLIENTDVVAGEDVGVDWFSILTLGRICSCNSDDTEVECSRCSMWLMLCTR